MKMRLDWQARSGQGIENKIMAALEENLTPPFIVNIV